MVNEVHLYCAVSTRKTHIAQSALQGLAFTYLKLYFQLESTPVNFDCHL